MIASFVFIVALSSAQQQLLGQPQVAAPQFLIANQTGLASPTTMPIQHLLIPVSTGNGTQQLVSIPLSLAAGLGNQMQLLATSSGQLIATNMAGLAPQLNLTIPTSSENSSESLLCFLVIYLHWFFRVFLLILYRLYLIFMSISDVFFDEEERLVRLLHDF